MNFYEILKTKKLGRGSPDYWTQLFAEHVGGTGEWKVAELTGTLPMIFRSNGTALINYRIYGKADGAGVQTENLFDVNDFTEGRLDDGVIGFISDTTNLVVNDNSVSCTTNRVWRGIVTNNMISLSAGAYTFCIAGYNDVLDSIINKLAVYNTQGEYENQIIKGGAEWVNAGNYAYYTFTVNESKRVRISFEWTSAGNHTVSNVVLVKGSTPPTTHIPYGYKLPLTVTSRTESKDTDIYIGDSKLGEEEYVDYESGKIYRWTDITGLSEPLCGIGTHTDSLDLSTGTLTRRIKKLVLTGEEDWKTYIDAYYVLIRGYYRLYDVGHHLSVCSHFPIKQVQRLPEMYYGLGGLIDGQTSTAWNGNIVFNPSPMIPSLTDWKSYLADQYAAGTPVTVWYVLDEPETSTIHVPSGLTGTLDGYLIQDGTPTLETPIYPTANGVKQTDGTYTIESVDIIPTDPPLPLPEISTFKGTNTLDSTETLGEVTIKGQIKPQS